TTMELILGAVTGTLVTTPISIITTLQQMILPNERHSALDTCTTIIKEEGIKGLWSGIKSSFILCITCGSFEKKKKI
ncbi:MAG: hypothetical protein EXX96DRAFT_470808, partial [Benjaminiella poitrasii]